MDGAAPTQCVVAHRVMNTLQLDQQLLGAVKLWVDWTKGDKPFAESDAIHWLTSIEGCLARLSAGERVNWGPEATIIQNFEVLSRVATSRLLHCRRPELSHSAINKFECFINSGPHHIERGPYRFSFDCFSPRIDSWRRDLSPFVGVPDLHFVEIDSLEGNSACWLLETVLTGANSKLTCIDPFPEGIEARFDANVSKAGTAEKLIKFRGYSRDILPRLPAHGYDFVYVDGSHHQVDVIEDAVSSWRLLRAGGIMVLDDYTLRANPINDILTCELHRPEIAIDAFLSIYKGRYEVIRIDDQVVVRKL